MKKRRKSREINKDLDNFFIIDMFFELIIDVIDWLIKKN